MFREVGEDSSSDDSSAPSENISHGRPHSSGIGLNLLSRVNTIDSSSAPRSGQGSGRATPHPSHPALSRNPSHVRDLLLHSLLEEKALREAAEHLGKDKSDPEVQQLARTTYQALSRQLPGQNDESLTSDLMRPHRAAVQEGLGTATRNHIAGLTSGNDGSFRALAARPSHHHSLSALNPLFSSLPTVLDYPLQGYPGLHTDRYIREFIELSVVGKGGYGTVFKVKHKLDNCFYAVKRIVVSPSRLQRIQQNGHKEMEKMLEEVRALARLDSPNVVRYHACWLEYTTSPSTVPLSNTTILRNDRLLEHDVSNSSSGGQVDDLQADLDSLSVGDRFKSHHTDSDGGIIFGYSDSDTGAGAEDSTSAEAKPRPPQRNRSSSQATIGTQSSVRSLLSRIESANGEDEDIETIPRDHQPQYPDPTTEMSESMLSNSDAPNRFLTGLGGGPALTLNVQMSLYDTNLADFLSQPSPASANVLQHCFHPCISLELLANIISGVEYLHAQGVVHRDLKPANIFLAVSTSKIPPSGSLDLSTCHGCAPRDCVYITPRIGDFGLVAALGEDSFTADTTVKPVGTELYRPEEADAKISEKLDVFALGVVCFEMLHKFSTRMERVETLARLRHGKYPDKFADRVGTDVQEMIASMVQPDEEKRLTCEEVKNSLRRILDRLHSDGQ